MKEVEEEQAESWEKSRERESSTEAEEERFREGGEGLQCQRQRTIPEVKTGKPRYLQNSSQGMAQNIISSP